MNFNLLYFVWNPDKAVFSIGNFEVLYYSLCWVLGLTAGYLIMKHLYKTQGIKEEYFDPLFIYCFLGIIIGARLGHCIFYEPEYYLADFPNFIEMLLPIKFSGDGYEFVGYRGLASHGGTIGLFIALWMYHRKTKLSFSIVLDNIAITTPVVAAMIRLGNFFNSEILGRATGSDWGVVFAQVDSVPRHPAQLYEAIAYIIIFVIGLIIYNRNKKLVGTSFFFGYCLLTIFTFRFFVEYVKEDQVAFEQGMLLNMGQILSIPFMAVGIYSMVNGYKKFKQQEN